MGIERLNEFWPEWKVTELLGSGAFGKVYKAVDEEAGFPVYSAIKVLSIPSSDGEIDALKSEGMSEAESRTYFKGIVDDFVNEIKLMHTLKGAANIVGVEAFKIAPKPDSIGWDIFIRMELLTAFKDYLVTHTPTEEDVVKLGVDIAKALEICQQKNIIHRDIKPANIFIDDFGSFKLGDFGIAKELEKTSGAVSAKGTFSYMAPEVARGMRYDNTVDIYSLGLVMYSLLNNNRPPFIDPNKADVSYNERRDANDRRLAGEALPMPCNASPGLADIILMACSFDPSKRFRSASAFKNALLSYKKAPAAAPTAKKPDIDETVAIARKPQSTGYTAQTTVNTSRPEPKAVPPVQPIRKPDITSPAPSKAVPPVQPVYQAKPEQPKKKKKGIIAVVAIVLVLAILAAVAIPFVLKSGNGNNNNDDNDADSKKNELKKSDTDEDTESASEDITPSDVNDSSEYPEISDACRVGDIVTLGHYEQDNDTANGMEEIEWRVLDITDGRALLISRYALDCRPYDEGTDAVTWETSGIREWLNNEFYNTAFGESERSMIESTHLINADNAEFNIDGGNDTDDKVFLLSIDEAEAYFGSDEERNCEASAYAEEQGAFVDSDDGNCWWWLRSPGGSANYGSYVSGHIDEYGFMISGSNRTVRPCVSVRVAEGSGALSEVPDTNNSTPSTETTEPEPDAASMAVGDTVFFGHYEQDNDTSNGAEQIEWIVLAKEDGKALVISKYALDCQPYNEEYASVTWEESDIRAWLNDDFYNTAFSESERSEIETTYVVNDDNAEYGTDGGNDTSDKIFLLSIAEAEEYFSSDEARECEPTKYAVAEGAYENSDNGNCWWWLRSPGYDANSAAFIYTSGDVDALGNCVDDGNYAVRPALWINL